LCGYASFPATIRHCFAEIKPESAQLVALPGLD